MKATKTGYNGRQRKALKIIICVYNTTGEMLDAILPGEGNHRESLEYAIWRAEGIVNEYSNVANIIVYCGETEIAQIECVETPEEVILTADNEIKYNGEIIGDFNVTQPRKTFGSGFVETLYWYYLPAIDNKARTAYTKKELRENVRSIMKLQLNK